ncbi:MULTISPECIES: hypothetical protein [unclassified Crossiella]|uniref:hypothetical protein n=1 Tax=unclassified Crossiella TaxID=2620835 RepID=UPI001FFE81EA|nr:MULTISPECIES: hypothetical protein [unclassified Crossiella]MCK2236416.1 hypothetical protein [Crossiella sp. S99.2]MCK2250083.1 hypothetical protein [Crossiella sp. S99.1]
MQTRTVLATLALAAGTALLAAPAAMAQPGTNAYTVDFEAGKTTFGAGSTFHLPARVMIGTDCAPDKASKVKLSGMGEIQLNGGSAGVAMGEFTIPKGVKGGKHTMTFTCGPVAYRGEFTIQAPPPATSRPRPSTSAAVPTKPKGAPETGGGGTTDTGLGGVLAGGGALLAGAALGGWLLRRRRGGVRS